MVDGDAMDWSLTALVPLAVILAIMDGLNNATNAIGWAIGGGVVGLKKALLIASVFEVIGGIAFGSYIIDTVNYRLVTDPMVLNNMVPPLAVYISSIVWSALASIVKIPISFSMAIIGGIIGTIATHSTAYIDWNTVLHIFTGWAAAFMVSTVLTALFLRISDIIGRYRGVSTYFEGVFIALLFTLLISKPLQPYISNISILVLVIFAVLYMVLYIIYRCSRGTQILVSVILVSIMHGANDSALISSILILYGIDGYGSIPILISSLGIAIGILLWGRRVVDTFASSISFLDIRYISTIYTSEFIAIALLLRLGLPTPISIVTIGALMGFGAYRGVDIIRLDYIVRCILITLASIPVCILLSHVVTIIARYYLVYQIF